jgi:S-adenosylmethionine uptake transporter
LVNPAIESLWIVAASLCFAIMGVFVKLASQHIALSDLLFYRCATSALVTMLMLRARGETVRTSRFRLHATRGLTGFFALALFFKAMKELPLATAVTLNYTSPIYMAAFSILAAPRQVRYLIPCALAVGFGGTVLLLKPTFASDQIVGGLIGALSGLMSAITYLNVKRLVQAKEPELRVVFYFSVIASVGALLWIFPTGLSPLDWRSGAEVFGLATFGTAGQVFMTRAYGKGDTMIAATLSYTGIIFSSIFGIAVWGDILSFSSWVAIALIIFASVVAIIAGK